MSKIWLVAVNEFRLNVLKKSFILVLLSVPLFIALNIVMVSILNAVQKNYSPVGYVDHSGILANPLPAPLPESEKPLEFTPYENEERARAALEARQIQAFYILPEDYLASGQVELVYQKQPGENLTRQFYNFIRVNLLSNQPPEVSRRAALGSNVIIYSLASGHEFPTGDPSLRNLLPLFIGIAFTGLLLFSSGYLMQSVSKEKENRTVEVLFTSLSPHELIWGKVLGVVAISFSQLATWILVGVVAVFIGGGVFGVAGLQNLRLDWANILMVLAVAIPAYIMASALMVTISLILTKPQDSEKFGPLLFLAFLLPVYFLLLFGRDPNGPIALTLSLLPFTSLLTISIRSMITTVPVWQAAASAAAQILYAFGALWIAARAFRLGMLRYGKQLSLAEILRKARVT